MSLRYYKSYSSILNLKILTPWSLEAEHRLYDASEDMHFNIQENFWLFFFLFHKADVFSEQQVIRLMAFPFAYCSN